MDRSGLPTHILMLVLGIGTASSSNSPHSGMRLRCASVPNMAICLNNDVFAGLRLPSFRPYSMCETEGKRTNRHEVDSEWVRPEREAPLIVGDRD